MLGSLVRTVPVVLAAAGTSASDLLRRAERHALLDVGGVPITPPATTVALAADRERLVVIFEADAEPPLRISARAMNEPVFQDECVELFWAEPDDPARYLEIVVNPRGAVYAARIHNPDASRATWTVTPGRVPQGLRVEIEGEPGGTPPEEWHRWRCLLSLPWTSASAGGLPPVPGSVWRGNLYRIARGRTTRFEALSATGRSDPPDFHVPPRFARFVFAEP